MTGTRWAQMGAAVGVLFWLGVGAWYGWKRFGGRAEAEQARAGQKMEDAAPALEPEVSVLVNGGAEARTVRGGPLYVTVAVIERHGANVAARLKVLEARARRLKAGGELEMTRAAMGGLAGRGRLRLGEAGRGWSEAVRVRLRPGGAWRLRRLGEARGAVELDGMNSAEAHWEPEGAVAEGEYEVEACLEATGGWRGRVCSERARLSVVGAATAAERLELDRLAARQELLAGRWAELERVGRGLLGRDGLAGHMALGDAAYGRGAWAAALKEYGAARRAVPKGLYEQPAAVDWRIAECLRRLGGG